MPWQASSWRSHQVRSPAVAARRLRAGANPWALDGYGDVVMVSLSQAEIRSLIEDGRLSPCPSLLMAERRKRIAVDSGSQLLEKLLVLPIEVAPEPPGNASWALHVLAIARAHQLTAHESSYLRLALTRGVALASNDQALVRAARAGAVPLLGD